MPKAKNSRSRARSQAGRRRFFRQHRWLRAILQLAVLVAVPGIVLIPTCDALQGARPSMQPPNQRTTSNQPPNQRTTNQHAKPTRVQHSLGNSKSFITDNLLVSNNEGRLLPGGGRGNGRRLAGDGIMRNSSAVSTNTTAPCLAPDSVVTDNSEGRLLPGGGRGGRRLRGADDVPSAVDAVLPVSGTNTSSSAAATAVVSDDNAPRILPGGGRGGRRLKDDGPATGTVTVHESAGRTPPAHRTTNARPAPPVRPVRSNVKARPFGLNGQMK